MGTNLTRSVSATAAGPGPSTAWAAAAAAAAAVGAEDQGEEAQHPPWGALANSPPAETVFPLT